VGGSGRNHWRISDIGSRSRGVDNVVGWLLTRIMYRGETAVMDRCCGFMEGLCEMEIGNPEDFTWKLHFSLTGHLAMHRFCRFLPHDAMHKHAVSVCHVRELCQNE